MRSCTRRSICRLSMTGLRESPISQLAVQARHESESNDNTVCVPLTSLTCRGHSLLSPALSAGHPHVTLTHFIRPHLHWHQHPAYIHLHNCARTLNISPGISATEGEEHTRASHTQTHAIQLVSTARKRQREANREAPTRPTLLCKRGRSPRTLSRTTSGTSLRRKILEE